MMSGSRHLKMSSGRPVQNVRAGKRGQVMLQWTNPTPLCPNNGNGWVTHAVSGETGGKRPTFHTARAQCAHSVRCAPQRQEMISWSLI